MSRGAFKSLQHDHSFTELGPGTTQVLDDLRFQAPFPILGPLAEILVLRRYMRHFLMLRNSALKDIAESDKWRQYLPGE